MAESSTRRAPFFATAMGLVIGSLLLFLLSIALAAAANAGLAQANFEGVSEQNRVLIIYAAYLLSVLTALFGLVLLIVGSVRWAMFGRRSIGVAEGSDVETELLESINARMLVSDTAKRIAYREEDIDLLKRTIKADVEKHEYDAALALVRELGETYGQIKEAEAFREKILNIRRTEMDARVAESLARLKEIVARQDFETATMEAEKIARLYPESPVAKEAIHRVEQARENYKQQLEREFLQASEHGDVDKAMELLKVMDKYLTEQEAEPLRETARGVIGKARDNLGVQFKLAVHDKEWVAAVNVGEQIIRDFPNSKMADEVRSMLDLLRQRAAGQQAATAR
jgi:tetratricopeptide (TPR) repeat protein